ncbi:glycosyltransferase [candidate division KSB3 bacterium]|uniref:Glycosyltransferase n=1 Tax=candidate division KSB3 bacterium TaxID=2044937 RepID=A0A9D5Q5Y2_9BACT|nr:glycosyltransferase [candidate division KSB3 bacterium]MBD3324717.1 glycosyltransferase [candidate division KSB3 bacterium]
MTKITIVFVLGTLEIGGTETQFLEIVRRLDRERFAPKVLAFPCEGRLRTAIEELQIPFACLGFSGIRGKFSPHSYGQLFGLLRQMVRYFRHDPPHIVQSYLFWANVYGAIAAKYAGVPVIITGRRELGASHLRKRHYAWLQNVSNLCSTAILANSQRVKAFCLETERWVTSQKIDVISNGIDPAKYAPQRSHRDLKQEFDIPETSPVVGIIANLHYCKGHTDFLHAASIVAASYPEAVFLIVGRDEGMRGHLEALAESLGIAQAVRFTGERRDIPAVLSLLDIQVSASLTESLSNAILEGMAAGKPIIATDVGGSAELVVHETTGLLVPPQQPERLAAAMSRLLGDCKLRADMGHAGRQRVSQKFHIDHTVRQTEALYLRLCRTAMPVSQEG